VSREPLDRYPRAVRLRRTPRESIAIEPHRRRAPRVQAPSAPLLLIGGFALASLLGAIVLALPFSAADGTWTSPVVALFVSTSAVCVTGLTPVDTATHWSTFGQAVILVLVQVGGLGIMTSTTLLFLLFGWRLGIRERLLLSRSLDLGRMGGVVSLIRRAIVFAFVVEAAGFVILTVRFLFDEPVDTALWYGLYHSVSAFNNAGFDLFGNFSSLTGRDDPITLVTIGALILLGSISFIVVQDVLDRIRHGDRLALDSRIVLQATAGLIAAAFVLMLWLEWDGVLGGESLGGKLLHSGFLAFGSRTAGFSAVPTSEMDDAAHFTMLAFMFIGGASGSTAGGIKVGTFAILVAAALSTAAGREYVEANGREIRRADVDRALTLALVSVIFVFLTTLILAQTEVFDFLDIMFEATSAFGTTGLSTGITPELSDASLLLLTIAMLVGRLGPLTLALALVQRQRPSRRRMAEERVRIG
jgi:trk system potassium uptake protein TrkH